MTGIIRTSNGVLLRTDVVTLQQSLNQCRHIADMLLHNRALELPEEVRTELMKITKLAKDGVFAAKMEREDSELELLKTGELPA